MSKKRKKNKKARPVGKSSSKRDILEDLYEDEGSGNYRARKVKDTRPKPASETLPRMAVPLEDDEIDDENEWESDSHSEEKSESDSLYRPDQYESRVWLIITVLSILLLIIIALAAGFWVFL